MRTMTACGRDSRAAAILQSLFKSQKFSDVVLKSASGAHWNVHKCILATTSDFFEAMFSGSFLEAEQAEIVINEVEDQILDILLDAAYGGALQTTESNILQVLKAANLLNFRDAESLCWDFIGKQLDDINSLDVLALSAQLGNRNVYNQALDRVGYNFKQIRYTDEYLEMDVRLLLKLLSSNDLRVNSEEDVLNAMMLWLNHDMSARKLHLSELVMTLRLPLLSEAAIVNTLRDLILSAKAQEYVSNGIRWLLSDRSLISDQILTPRKTIFNKVAAVSFIQERLLVHAYCPLSNTWTRNVVKCKLHCPHTMYYVHDRCLYSFSTMIKRYSFVTDTWEDVVWFRSARQDFAVTAGRNELFIMGGRKHRIEKLGHRLQLLTNDWTTVAELLEEREHAVAVHLEGKVFLIGGRSQNEILATLDAFDVATNEWQERSPMNNPRMMPECVVLGDAVYVFGGFAGLNNRLFVPTIEKYDTRTNQWTECGSVGDENHTFSLSATTFERRIYLLLNNDTSCLFGYFDTATCVFEIIDEIIKQDHSADLDLAYSTIHGIRPYLRSVPSSY